MNSIPFMDRVRATNYFLYHKSLMDKWEYGEIVKSWREQESICIRYEYGGWFRYEKNENGDIKISNY